MQLRKIILLVLVLVVVALGAAGAMASGNDCDGQIDQSCHRGHDAQGNPKDWCDFYINLGSGAPPLCLIIPEPTP